MADRVLHGGAHRHQQSGPVGLAAHPARHLEPRRRPGPTPGPDRRHAPRAPAAATGRTVPLLPRPARLRGLRTAEVPPVRPRSDPLPALPAHRGTREVRHGRRQAAGGGGRLPQQVRPAAHTDRSDAPHGPAPRPVRRPRLGPARTPRRSPAEAVAGGPGQARRRGRPRVGVHATSGHRRADREHRPFPGRTSDGLPRDPLRVHCVCVLWRTSSPPGLADSSTAVWTSSRRRLPHPSPPSPSPSTCWRPFSPRSPGGPASPPPATGADAVCRRRR